MYQGCLTEILENTPASDPFTLLHAIGKRQPVAGCMGVYICNDLDFNREYCRLAREIYVQYIAKKAGDFVSLGWWNLLIEQLVFGELHFQTYGREPDYLLDSNWPTTPTNPHGFCHVWGAKRSDEPLNSVEQLRSEHPKLFHRIVNRFNTKLTNEVS